MEWTWMRYVHCSTAPTSATTATTLIWPLNAAHKARLTRWLLADRSSPIPIWSSACGTASNWLSHHPSPTTAVAPKAIPTGPRPPTDWVVGELSTSIATESPSVADDSTQAKEEVWLSIFLDRKSTRLKS